MTGKLQEEIRQSRPFRSAEQEAYLTIIRTADALVREVERLLKPHGLTSTQYNVLRILRGAGDQGAACSAIAGRLIKADPDVTRLLDRMEKSALIERWRSSADRRVVLAKLTPLGAKLVAELDSRIDDLHKRQFKGSKGKALALLVEQLDLVREAIAQRETAE